VAYVECAEGGVDGSSPLGSRSKAPVGVWGIRSFFVDELLNFDVLEEKISTMAKNTIIKIRVG